MFWIKVKLTAVLLELEAVYVVLLGSLGSVRISSVWKRDNPWTVGDILADFYIWMSRFPVAIKNHENLSCLFYLQVFVWIESEEAARSTRGDWILRVALTWAYRSLLQLKSHVCIGLQLWSSDSHYIPFHWSPKMCNGAVVISGSHIGHQN